MYIHSVQFVVHEQSLMLRNVPDVELFAIASHPVVAFQVDEADDTSLVSVVVKGEADGVELQSKIDAADQLPLVPWVSAQQHTWLQVTPTSLSGRRYERTPGMEQNAIVDG